MTAARTRKAAEPAAGAGPDTAFVSSKQLRQLHALLAGHGVNGDATRHDYLTTWAERTIEHASDLTTVEAARLIAELDSEDAPEVTTPSRTALKKLREPFPPEAVGKLPRSTCRDCSKSQRKRCDNHTWVSGCRECRGSHSSATMHIDYIGHADVTDRLLDVDPTWTWVPMAQNGDGFPLLDQHGGLWINLTVCGVTRPGYGEGSSGQQSGGDTVKVAIGDALRNAAMRFGIGLELWVKGDRDWAKAEKHGAEQMAPDQAPPPETAPPTPAPPPYTGPTVEDSIGALIGLADQQSTDLATITRRFREEHGNLTVDQLATDVPAHALDVFVGQCRDYLAQQAAPAGAQA